MVETARILGGTYIPSGAEQYSDGAPVGSPQLPATGLRPGDRLALVVNGVQFDGYVRAIAGEVATARGSATARGVRNGRWTDA